MWLTDLGMTAKIRPCLVLSTAIGEIDRALITLVPHTTSTRGTQFEADVKVPFLREGAFDAQGLLSARYRGSIRSARSNSSVTGSYTSPLTKIV